MNNKWTKIYGLDLYNIYSELLKSCTCLMFNTRYLLDIVCKYAISNMFLHYY